MGQHSSRVTLGRGDKFEACENVLNDMVTVDFLRLKAEYDLLDQSEKQEIAKIFNTDL